MTWPNIARKKNENFLLCSLLLQLCRMHQSRVPRTRLMKTASSIGKRHGVYTAGNCWDTHTFDQMKTAMKCVRKDELLSALQT